MEQPCYKCGQAVEEGTPFCPHCSAPQIRVVIAEPTPVSAQSAEAVITPHERDLPASQTVPVLAVSMQWSQSIRPCALAAMIACLLMALGLNPFVAMFIVGFLAVLLFRMSAPGIAIKTVSAAGLGALGGLLWFVVSAVFEILVVILLNKGPELRAEMAARIQQAASQTSDPQVLVMLDRFKTHGGLEVLIVAGTIFALAAAIVLAGVGGILAGAILARRNNN